MTGLLFRPMSLPLLLLVSALLGLGLMARTVPVALVLGTAPYWEFPQLFEIIGSNDVADVLLGNIYFINAPWGWPLLHIPKLGAPAGTNLYWLDAIPWLALLGKLAGQHLLGPYWVVCFVGPGMAMTWLLAEAGERNLAMAVAGTLLANNTIPLLGRGGGLALSAMFLLVVALALYVRGARGGRGVAAGWIALLALAVATNVYLLAMIGGVWAASLLQRLGADRRPARAGKEAVVGLVAVLGVVYAAGMLSGTLRGAGGSGFGMRSMNLLAPLVPQDAGLIPASIGYRIGLSGQFADTNVYLGLGVLALVGAAILTCLAHWRWAVATARRHMWLGLLLAGCVAFALSHRVYLGSRLLLAVPLPETLLYTLGTIGTSIRFFWLVGYALTAAALVVLARHWRPPALLAMLALACLAQLLDVEPTRARMAANLAGPAPAAIDRAAVRAELAGARSVLVYPSWGCVLPLVESGRMPQAERDLRLQQNVEIQLLAARANLPINSVYNARLRPDCAVEAAEVAKPPPPGAVMFLLKGFPSPSGTICRTVGDLTVCRAR